MKKRSLKENIRIKKENINQWTKKSRQRNEEEKKELDNILTA